MEIQSGIYKITNTKNNRIYVGSTHDFGLRFYKHKNALNSKTRHNIFLENDWHKCGEESFIFEPILTIKNIETILDIEQYFIDLFWDNCVNCYNISKDSRAPSKGVPLSTEHRQNISNAHKGKKLKESHKKNISNSNKGKNIGDKNGSKRGPQNHLFGKPKSRTHKNNISKSKSGPNHQNYGKQLKKSTRDKIGKANGKPIISINIENEIIEFNSISEASRYYGCNPETIKNNILKNKIIKKINILFEYKIKD